MRKYIVCGVVVLLLVACGPRKTAIDPFEPIKEMVDSISHHQDSLSLVEKEEEPQPSEADELFDDFIFNYASDSMLQLKRTKFPLPYYKENEPLKIEKGEWNHDPLFTKESAYTLLFDNEDQMDLVGDTTLKSVQVEWIYLKDHMVKRYYFERIRGVWMLEAINLRHIEKRDKEDFVSFYAQFAADTLFQLKHIAQPLQYVTIDPDDEFSILETTLDAAQWAAFRPQLPDDRLSNIDYGQHSNDHSQTKILKINGIGNGYSNVCYFRRRAGRWELYRYEDTGM